MSLSLTTVAAEELGSRTPFAQGSQAQIHVLDDFRLPGYTQRLAYKEYFRGSAGLHLAGLESIVRRRAELSTEDRAQLDDFAAWPVATVVDGSTIVGILMPLITRPFTFTLRLSGSRTTEEAPCKLQYAFIEPDRAGMLGAPVFDTEARLALASGFAAALAFLHERGIVFGDISANNAMFYVSAERCRIMLVDCDAVRIVGSAPVVPQLNSPDWDPPERSRGQVDQTVRTDVYKFGLLLLRLVAPGPLASIRREVSGSLPGLTAIEMDLLVRSLDEDDTTRPTMQEWVDAFQRLRNSNTTDTPAARTVGTYRERPGGGWVRVATPDRPVPNSTETPHSGWERGDSGGWIRRST